MYMDNGLLILMGLCVFLCVLIVGIFSYAYGRKDKLDEIERLWLQSYGTDFPAPPRSMGYAPLVGSLEGNGTGIVHRVWVVMVDGAIREAWHSGRIPVQLAIEDHTIMPQTVTTLEKLIDDGEVRPVVFVPSEVES